ARMLEASRSETEERRLAGARLAALAGQVIDVEPLVHGHAVRRKFSRVMERYRVASQTLESDGAIGVAQAAIEEAERHLRRVADYLGVPLAASSGEATPVDASTVSHYGRGKRRGRGDRR